MYCVRGKKKSNVQNIILIYLYFNLLQYYYRLTFVPIFNSKHIGKYASYMGYLWLSFDKGCFSKLQILTFYNGFIKF